MKLGLSHLDKGMGAGLASMKVGSGEVLVSSKKVDSHLTQDGLWEVQESGVRA